MGAQRVVLKQMETHGGGPSVPVPGLLRAFLPIGTLVLQSLRFKPGGLQSFQLRLHYSGGSWQAVDIFITSLECSNLAVLVQVLGNSLKLVAVASLVATVFDS